MAKSTAEWRDLDVEQLSGKQRELYAQYKARYAEMTAAREAFEAAMVEGLNLPAGKRLAFGYRFGKLSAALVDDDRKAAKPQQSKGTLAEWMAQQQRAGR